MPVIARDGIIKLNFWTPVFVMMHYFLGLLLLFSTALSSLTLSDKLYEAKEGDFAVSMINKSYTLIHIVKKKGSILLFEEISVPVSCMKGSPNWRQFMQNNAPGAIAWVLYEVDLKSGSMLECYSVLDEAFFDVTSFDHILTKLMHLPLSRLDEKEQRHIGSATDVDTRKVWKPVQVFEQAKVKDPKFDVYKATWPDDGTILSHKSVEIYFDAKRSDFPFPFWMQVKDASDASFKVPTVDGGRGLKSLTQDIPRRRPYFYDKVETYPDKIVIKVSLPIYYEGMKLYASSFMSTIDKPILCEAVMRRVEGECVEFEIAKTFIHKHLDVDKPYHFLLTSDSFPDITVESARCVRFSN